MHPGRLGVTLRCRGSGVHHRQRNKPQVSLKLPMTFARTRSRIAHDNGEARRTLVSSAYMP